MTGIVLAGGQSRRLGRNKALEPIGGTLLLRRVLDRLSIAVDEVVVVVRDEDWVSPYLADCRTRVVADVYPGLGALAGIFAGLQAARHTQAFVCACDMPFLSPPLLRHLQGLADDVDVVVPVVGGHEEPTHAIYAKRCLGPMAQRLDRGSARVIDFFSDVRVRYVGEIHLRSFDRQLLSFFNVNTPQDLERARRLAAADASDGVGR